MNSAAIANQFVKITWDRDGRILDVWSNDCGEPVLIEAVPLCPWDDPIQAATELLAEYGCAEGESAAPR